MSSTGAAVRPEHVQEWGQQLDEVASRIGERFPRSETRDRVEMLVHEAELFSIAFTPAKEERPNGLDVWQHRDRSTKVLDVIWTDGTMPLILAYRGGIWEKLLRQQLTE